MNRFGLPLVFVSILAGVAFGWVIATQAPMPERKTGFEFVDHGPLMVDLTPFTDGNTSWRLVVLGYLHCPDVCPTTMAQLQHLLADEALPLQVLFVSVDPGRDSAQGARQFARRFGEMFDGTTASHGALQAFTRQLGTGYRVPDEPVAKAAKKDEFYLVTHSPVMTLVDPAGRIQARLRPGFDAALAKSQLTRLIGGGISQVR